MKEEYYITEPEGRGAVIWAMVIIAVIIGSIVFDWKPEPGKRTDLKQTRKDKV